MSKEASDSFKVLPNLSYLKRFIGAGSVYFLGDILNLSLSFLLLPVYSRLLGSEQYGIIGVALSFSTFLAPILTWALLVALMRLYVDFDAVEERKKFLGTLLVFLVIGSGAIALMIVVLGGQGLFFSFRRIPFSPYLDRAVWLSYLTSIMNVLPMGIFRIREEPVKYISLSLALMLITGTLTVLAVGPMGRGAEGALTARIIGSLIVLLVALYMVREEFTLGLHPRYLKLALALSLPLIPHSIAQWVLNLSDKWLLERFLPLQEVGIYTAAYQIGTVAMIMNASLRNVWQPIFFKLAKKPSEIGTIRQLGTYYVMAMCFLGLVVGTLGVDVFLILTPEEFHPGKIVIPFVALGGAATGVYQVLSTSVFFSKRTQLLPFVTIIAGLANVGLNIVLIPRIGILAAGINTFIGYTLLALLVWPLARQTFDVGHEYRRWTIAATACGLLLAVGMWISTDSIYVSVAIHSGLLLLYPVALSAFGFWSQEEKQLIARTLVAFRERLALFV